MVSCKKELIITQVNNPITQINDTSTNVKFKEFIYSENEVRKMGVDVSAPILFDYNSNGKYDIIICKKVGIRNGNKYTYDRLNPIVILDNNQIKEITNLWKCGSSVTTGDFNGDGYIDIAEFDNGPEFYDIDPLPTKTDLVVWWNSKNGLTGDSVILDKILWNSYALTSADLDGDKKADLVRMDFPHNDNYFKFNGKSFDKLPINNLPNVTNSGLFFSDLDGDSSMDAITSAYGSPNIIWNFLNNKQKTILSIPKGLGVNNTIAGDFDNDGFKDIIFVCQKENVAGEVFENKHYYLYYKNNGKNNYELTMGILPESVSYQQANNPLYVIKDIDGDGDLDFYNVNSDLNAFFINNKGVFKRVNKFGYVIQ
jgi:hypothetical protein